MQVSGRATLQVILTGKSSNGNGPVLTASFLADDLGEYLAKELVAHQALLTETVPG